MQQMSKDSCGQGILWEGSCGTQEQPRSPGPCGQRKLPAVGTLELSFEELLDRPGGRGAVILSLLRLSKFTLYTV